MRRKTFKEKLTEMLNDKSIRPNSLTEISTTTQTETKVVVTFEYTVEPEKETHYSKHENILRCHEDCFCSTCFPLKNSLGDIYGRC